MLLISVAIGIIGSILGIGGGIFLVPILTLILDIDIRIAAATSLVAIIVMSSTSSSSYLHEGLVNVKLGMFLETFTTAGAVIGAVFVVILEPSTIEIVLGVTLVYTAIYMQLKKEENIIHKGEGPLSAFRSRFRSRFRDPAANKVVEYDVENIGKGAAGSFIAGNLSGLVGIGGGIIKVPAMNIWMGVPIKAATATSNFMLGVTAVASAIVYISNGFIAPALTAVVAIGIFLGASIGSRTLPRISAGRVRTAFAAILVVIGILMFMKAAGLVVS